jgi:hypothetical protein
VPASKAQGPEFKSQTVLLHSTCGPFINVGKRGKKKNPREMIVFLQRKIKTKPPHKIKRTF